MAIYMDDLMKNIHDILENVTIKYDAEASKYETLETRINADKYLSALENLDTFRSYETFDTEALRLAGCTQEQISEWYYDKNKIPLEMRDVIVAQQRRIVIRDYVELNSYYRTICGLPDLDDKEELFAPPDYYADLGILPCPIHQLPDPYINLMEKSGLLDTYREMYPNKKYLNYLGTKRVDLVVARRAMNFGIIKLDTSLMNSKIYETFTMCYESAREYYMRVIYNKDLNKSYDNYNNLIGLCIMLTALNKLIQANIKNVIERDLFDLNTIRLLYEAYNIPFVNKLPIEYHRILVRNINYLLSNKSTDKVLIDLLELFGYSHIQMFKYYLVKQHKKDDQGNPLFIHKENEKGEDVLDYEKMFSFHFQAVNVKERNVARSIVESFQTEKYSTVIADDPYWVDDNDLRNALYTREFNYIETKYIGINIMYLMTNKLFDLQYGIRMLLDSKDDLDKFDIKITRLFGLQKFKIFDVVIALMYLLCKRSGFKGNVLVNPGQISSIKGFNFKENIKIIAADIYKNPLIDNAVADKLLEMDFKFVSDVNVVYNNICFLYRFIVENRYRASSMEVYKAYDELFNTLLITQENADLFKTPDGTFMETYEEYLKRSNIGLYNFLSSVPEHETTSVMDILIESLIDIIPDFTNLRIVNNSDNVLVTALIKLITYFKSYTTDIINLSSYYFLNDKADNILKLIGSSLITHWDDMSTKQYLTLIYDHMGGYMSDIYLKDIVNSRDELENLGDTIGGWKSILHKEHTKIIDMLMKNVKVDYRIDEINKIKYLTKALEKFMNLNDVMNLPLSEIHAVESYIKTLNTLSVRDNMPDYISDIDLRDDIDEYQHELDSLSVKYLIKEIMSTLNSSITDITKEMELGDSSTFNDGRSRYNVIFTDIDKISSEYDHLNSNITQNIKSNCGSSHKITIIRE